MSKIPVLMALCLMLSSNIFGIAITKKQKEKEADAKIIQKEKDILKPWFTGPLLCPAGHVVPGGHTNWEPYVYVTDTVGVYGHNSRHTASPSIVTVNPLLSLTHGLTEWMDIQVIPQFISNTTQGQHDFRFGDFTLYLGFQLLTDKPHTWVPDLRFTLNETFPSGHYDHLDPKELGTDQTGTGSYQSGFSFNFQKLLTLKTRLLRLRLNLSYSYPSKVNVQSFNAYGGGFGTRAKVSPGQVFSGILAGEYTLTQHWIAAIDISYFYKEKRTFSGEPGVKADGSVASLSGPHNYQLSLAPALEYNFNSSLGVIFGVWFSVTGRDSTDFTSGVVALNYYH